MITSLINQQNSRLWTTLISLCLLLVCTVSVMANDYDQDAEKEWKPKLWFLRETSIAGVPLYLSPLSIFTIFIVSIHVILNWGTYAWCEASHILIKVHSPEAKQALKELRDEIGSDIGKFAEAAKKNSDCPSGRKYRKSDVAVAAFFWLTRFVWLQGKEVVLVDFIEAIWPRTLIGPALIPMCQQEKPWAHSRPALGGT